MVYHTPEELFIFPLSKFYLKVSQPFELHTSVHMFISKVTPYNPNWDLCTQTAVLHVHWNETKNISVHKSVRYKWND